MDKEGEDSRSSANGTRGGAGDSAPKPSKTKKKKSLSKPAIESQLPASDSSTDEEPEPRGEKWSCSVCTFENSAGAFKCSMCCVRKGTSTRKPRINVQLQAQQVARQQQQIQQQALKATARAKEDNRPERKRPPSPSSSIGTVSTSSDSKRRNSSDASPHPEPLVSPGPSKNGKEGKKVKKLDKAKEGSDKKVSPKKIANGAKKFRMDRSNSMSNAVTVNNVTVIITEFKPLKKDLMAKKVGKAKLKEKSNGKQENGVGAKKDGKDVDKNGTKKKVVKKAVAPPSAPATAAPNSNLHHGSSEPKNGSSEPVQSK